MQIIILPSPIGNLRITLQDDVITKVNVARIKLSTLFADNLIRGSKQSTDATKEITQQLQTYFQHPSHIFTLKTNPHGTPFQQRVWQALTQIPAGTTLTYGELAKKLKSSPRAVGQACRRNPIPVIIPCHRVVGATSIGGYAGETQGEIADIKQWLLRHEKLNNVKLK